MKPKETPNQIPDETKTAALRSQLVGWYEKGHRPLPWRQTRNPYHIWISEVMLQQTQVDTVIDYYNAFIQKFPTIKDLAEADEESVLKAWEGLGYYSRAKNLHRAAKVMVEKHGGKMPVKYEEILALPGIGPYTAGAVASIAFGEPVPAVDGNVMRVFSRVFYITEDIMQNATRKKFNEIGQGVVSPENPSYFNQALMELGALICTPTSPKCHDCPIQNLCRARELGVERGLPVKAKKAKKREVDMEMALVCKGEQILITKRPPTGILADLWALPAAEKQDGMAEGERIRIELEENYGIKAENVHYMLEKTHVFTHMKWHMRLYRMDFVEEKAVQYPQMQWIRMEEIGIFALPTAFKKLFRVE